jgi:hypothetical protein
MKKSGKIAVFLAAAIVYAKLKIPQKRRVI